MDISEAIEMAKGGCHVARAGWNGRGMYVAYQPGYPDGIIANKQTRAVHGLHDGDLVAVQPYLQLRCVDGSFQMWVASQSDLLADDWEIV